MLLEHDKVSVNPQVSETKARLSVACDFSEPAEHELWMLFEQ